MDLARLVSAAAVVGVLLIFFRWLAVTRPAHWWIGLGGSDENSGRSRASRLRTFAELSRRIGAKTIRKPHVIHVVGDMSEPISLSWTLGKYALVTFVGEEP